MFQFICTVFLLFIAVQQSGGECVRQEEKIYKVQKYANRTEVRLRITDICNKVEQLQLEEIRLQQNRQSELQNDVMNKLNELNEKLNKLTSLESNVDLIRSEQNRQSESQNEMMGTLKDMNEKINSLESKIISELNKPSKFPSSCDNVTAVNRRSGIHQIVVPSYSRDPFNVSCDEETQGGGWTTVLRRQDGSVDFFRFWNDYKNGIGNPSGEFFIGLEKLHFMTKAVDQELLITMEHPNGKYRFAKYDRFAIDGENEAYKLSSLGRYSGNAGDSLRYHKGSKFTSRDNDNDDWDMGNCAKDRTGGWWYQGCHGSNLMGKYNETEDGKGINWLYFVERYTSLKRVEMMIRPRRD